MYEARLSDHRRHLAHSPDQYIVGDADPHLFDVFEPTYIQSAFQGKPTTLAHLVFGRAGWEQLSSMHPPNLALPKDPLTRVFAELGMLDRPTHLHMGSYDQSSLFLSPTEMRAAMVETKLEATLRTSNAKVLCDIFCLQGVTKRNSQTFVEVVKSRKVAVGPLEYYGIGQRITRAGPDGMSNWRLVVCDESPRLEEHFRQRQRAHDKRIADGRHKGGHRKSGSKKAAELGGWHAKPMPKPLHLLSSASSSSLPQLDQGDESPPLMKKCRLSVDAKVMLGLLV
ncbi:hypothetical protein OH76DRAFT_1484694 [Lentinus brumalis]|uniref:Uncharacterized protein n=1 Tax=Lentinus brumalis TaxID=2498619 RepID=A0A371D4V9_9APHY|nr:hypothetical protein OH76DRAFT_1484694 [Polyporus brumalis]